MSRKADPDWVGRMVVAHGGGAAQFCTRCGRPLGGLPACPSCGTPAPPIPRVPRPPPSVRSTRRLQWAAAAVAVAIVIALVVLSIVPVAERAEFQQDLPVYAAQPPHCGHSIYSGLAFPAGKTVYFSWTTNPSANVSVEFNWTVGYNETEVFTASGISGNHTIYSNGDSYLFDVHNCQDYETDVTFSAYYNYNAPLL